MRHEPNKGSATRSSARPSIFMAEKQDLELRDKITIRSFVNELALHGLVVAKIHGAWAQIVGDPRSKSVILISPHKIPPI